MVGELKAFVLGNGFLQLFNLGFIKLLDTATIQAHQMVVVLAFVEFKHRLAAFKVRSAQKPGLFKLGEHAVDGGQANVNVF